MRVCVRACGCVGVHVCVRVCVWLDPKPSRAPGFGMWSRDEVSATFSKRLQTRAAARGSHAQRDNTVAQAMLQ